ncbi:hypothetical protein BM1_10213 [Bipolaris maydis]|nr:hypothetical protein BM1_10213 [Bipolaris maydis]
MRSQIFAGLALAAVAAAAPMESRASDEQVTINNAVFVRQDGNANDNWDTITSVSLSLTTPSGSVNCNASSFPDPSVPSNVYPCADSTYSFQISSRPGYDLYAITVTHKVSDSKQRGKIQAIAGHQASIWAPGYLGQRYLGYEGWSDLALASYLGLKQVVHIILFEEKTDVDIEGGEYGRALQAASLEGHEKIAHILLSAGADVNAQGGEYGNALQAASAGGYRRVVTLLLNDGANVSAWGGGYGSAFHAASDRDYEKIVRLLLNIGADVNAQGGYCGSALQAASSEGYEQIVKLLLNAGAGVNM